MAGYDADRARSEFGIPEGFTPIAMIAIGYPTGGKLEDLDEKLRAKELGLTANGSRSARLRLQECGTDLTVSK